MMPIIYSGRVLETTTQQQWGRLLEKKSLGKFLGVYHTRPQWVDIIPLAATTEAPSKFLPKMYVWRSC